MRKWFLAIATVTIVCMASLGSHRAEATVPGSFGVQAVRNRARRVVLGHRSDTYKARVRAVTLKAHKGREGLIMRRFFVAVIIGSAIAAAASTSASAWHCLASSPNGAAGTAFGVILERAQSISMRRCIHRGGGAGCQIAWCRPY